MLRTNRTIFQTVFLWIVCPIGLGAMPKSGGKSISRKIRIFSYFYIYKRFSAFPFSYVRHVCLFWEGFFSYRKTEYLFTKKGAEFQFHSSKVNKFWNKIIGGRGEIFYERKVYVLYWNWKSKLNEKCSLQKLQNFMCNIKLFFFDIQ